MRPGAKKIPAGAGKGRKDVQSLSRMDDAGATGTRAEKDSSPSDAFYLGNGGPANVWCALFCSVCSSSSFYGRTVKIAANDTRNHAPEAMPMATATNSQCWNFLKEAACSSGVFSIR